MSSVISGGTLSPPRMMASQYLLFLQRAVILLTSSWSDMVVKPPSLMTSQASFRFRCLPSPARKASASPT